MEKRRWMVLLAMIFLLIQAAMVVSSATKNDCRISSIHYHSVG